MSANPAVQPNVVAGPPAWLNLLAVELGRNARTTSSSGSVLMRRLWCEYSLYSDAQLAGAIELPPFRLGGSGASGRSGEASRQATLFCRDHLTDDLPVSQPARKVDHEVYIGGDLGDEIAALVALALGRRVRSGGVIRERYSYQAVEGEHTELLHQVPVLVAASREPMIPGIEQSAELSDVLPLLVAYRRLDASTAVVLSRAAIQYADALWLADADPRVAWLKLVGAVEAAADAWDAKQSDTAMERVARHDPSLAALLRLAPTDVANEVAKRLAHTLKATAKFRDFVVTFAPGPPTNRPVSGDQFDWRELARAMSTIYGHRSNDVHSGIPFPMALLEPPHATPQGPAGEAFDAVGLWSAGGYWDASAMPMYFHVFAYIVRGALLRWIAERSVQAGTRRRQRRRHLAQELLAPPDAIEARAQPQR